jgi:hypothetical protein
MNIHPHRLLALSAILLLPLPMMSAAAPDFSKLLPTPPDVREILNQRCVMCHGEVIAGKAEIREDLDLSTDAKIQETLHEPGRLKEMIANDEMPQKAKLSFRLRKDDTMKARLETLKADYAKSGEKEKLMVWLKDVVATVTPKKKKKDDAK